MLAPWMERYDKPRQRIKKQRHHFADKGPSSQNYGFSSSHIQMYRTDFWTLWEKARVGSFKRTASKHVYYLG